MTPVPPGIGARLEQLARFGAWEGGIDRPLFSAADRAAREAFAGWGRALGCAISQDRFGNVFVRREGRGAGAPILFGSHLDTVRTGGAYDGAYGVAGAIEALARIVARGAVTEHPLEAVAWAGEEGNRFPLGCLGSAGYAALNAAAEIDALTDAAGVTFAGARDGLDGLLPGVEIRTHAPRPAAYLEIHIEQGPVLERAGRRLGIVTAIAGQYRYDVSVDGTSGHAGTVPMAARRDALVGAAALVGALDAAVREVGGDAVLTVGRLDVEPNQANVIPGRVRFRIDARGPDAATLTRLDERIAAVCDAIARERGVAVALAPSERRAAVPLDERLQGAFRDAVAACGEPVFALPSGAGHDAMCIARIAPAAMLFVPSREGRSHVGTEFTAPADLELGVTALTDALERVDRLLP